MIQNKLKELFPELVGEIKINHLKNLLIISGDVSVSDKNVFDEALKNVILEVYPNKMLSNSLRINEFVVLDDTVQTNKELTSKLDEIDILYYGWLDVDHIIPNQEFKTQHESNRDKLDNIVRVLEFIAPIVLDSDLKIVDGHFRLQLAKANGIKKVMVVVIDDNDVKANFLRLALNRTAEFQRWNYREVDNYVDATPQAQPLLEPIGFFGRNVLPTSFFSETILNYIIDPFNEKQKQYSQEEGLAEWAEYRRSQMAKLSAEKRAPKPPKDTENAVSLFDLQPKKEDFLERYDIDKEMEEFVDKYKDIAEEITQRADAVTLAQIEEKGGVWQRTHRSPQVVAEHNRLEAIAKVQDTDLLTEEEKAEILESIDDYADKLNNIEELAKELRGEI